MIEKHADQASRLRRLMQDAHAGGSMPPSVQTGRVSYGPDRHGAGTTTRSALEPTAPVRLARALAIASGKGGVGKSNVAVNLASALSARGVRTCLLDADLGLANADVLCGLTPRLTLDDVVARRCRLPEVVIPAPGGFRLVPGASGVARMANLPAADRNSLLRQLESLERMADVILIDTGAGIGQNVLGFAAAAGAVLVTATPEPTSITDAYATIKSLHSRCPDIRVELLVNMTSGEAEARDVHERIARVAETFLGREVAFAGSVPFDAAVRDAVRCRYPVTLHRPRSAASRAVRGLADRYIETFLNDEISGRPRPAGFFARLADWMGIRDEGRHRSLSTSIDGRGDVR